MGISNSISKILTSSRFISIIEEIKNEAIEELKQSIQVNFYDAYDPKVYVRTFQFLNAVRGELSVTANAIELKIYLDANSMEHPSVVDGENSYVPPLLYYGHHQKGYNAVDYFHNYPGRNEWWDEAVNMIRTKVQARVSHAIVSAITTTKYR